jgi:type I restriction enzyme S subunit
MAFDDSRALLRDLLLETKDGEWGKDQPSGDSVEMVVIRGTDFPHVRVGDLSSSPTRHIARKAALRKTLEAGDILIETAGGSKGRPTGRTIYISKEILIQASMPVTCASFARFLRVDPNLAEPEFVFWFLQALYASGAIEKHQVQHSGIARFQYTKFASEVEILLPSRSEQMVIARTMGVLDEKITLLRETNATLESTAQALFKSWFVDFDPVRAIAEGRDTEGVPPEVADLFPSEFEDSEMGVIPKGWRVAPLEEHLDVVRGLSYKGIGLTDSDDPEGVPMHNLNSVLEGGGYKYAGLKFYKGEFKPKHEIKPGDIIVANTEQGHKHLLIGFPAVVPITGRRSGLFSHHLYRVRTLPHSPLGHLFLFRLLLVPAVREQVIGCSNGTTVNMLKADGLAMPRFICPPRPLVEAYERVAGPIQARQEQNVAAAENLATLRDTLLPRLMSGKLRIPEVKEELPV